MMPELPSKWSITPKHFDWQGFRKVSMFSMLHAGPGVER
jgi:hypothetical protein